MAGLARLLGAMKRMYRSTRNRTRRGGLDLKRMFNTMRGKGPSKLSQKRWARRRMREPLAGFRELGRGMKQRVVSDIPMGKALANVVGGGSAAAKKNLLRQRGAAFAKRTFKLPLDALTGAFKVHGALVKGMPAPLQAMYWGWVLHRTYGMAKGAVGGAYDAVTNPGKLVIEQLAPAELLKDMPEEERKPIEDALTGTTHAMAKQFISRSDTSKIDAAHTDILRKNVWAAAVNGVMGRDPLGSADAYALVHPSTYVDAVVTRGILPKILGKQKFENLSYWQQLQTINEVKRELEQEYETKGIPKSQRDSIKAKLLGDRKWEDLQDPQKMNLMKGVQDEVGRIYASKSEMLKNYKRVFDAMMKSKATRDYVMDMAKDQFADPESMLRRYAKDKVSPFTAEFLARNAMGYMARRAISEADETAFGKQDEGSDPRFTDTIRNRLAQMGTEYLTGVGDKQYKQYLHKPMTETIRKYTDPVMDYDFRSEADKQPKSFMSRLGWQSPEPTPSE